MTKQRELSRITIRRSIIKYVLCALLSVFYLSGCQGSRLGSVVSVEIPKKIFVNTATNIKITTTENACFSVDKTVVNIDALIAEIKPYVHFNGYPDGSLLCTAPILYFEHNATVEFSQTGTATIRVIGYHEAIERTTTVF